MYSMRCVVMQKQAAAYFAGLACTPPAAALSPALQLTQASAAGTALSEAAMSVDTDEDDVPAAASQSNTAAHTSAAVASSLSAAAAAAVASAPSARLTSGGYADHVFRYAAQQLHGISLPLDVPLQYRQGRNADLHEVTLEAGGQVLLKFATAYGFRNIQVRYTGSVPALLFKLDQHLLLTQMHHKSVSNGLGDLKINHA